MGLFSLLERREWKEAIKAELAAMDVTLPTGLS